MPTRTLLLALVATGCHRAPPRQTLPVVTRPDVLALRGAHVDEVGRAYAVTVSPDGVTTLAGDGVDCSRQPAAGWSLKVSSRAGRVRVVELMWCGAGPAPEIADSLRRRLGDPSHGACSDVCSWSSTDAFLAHHDEETGSYDVLVLE